MFTRQEIPAVQKKKHATINKIVKIKIYFVFTSIILSVVKRTATNVHKQESLVPIVCVKYNPRAMLAI